MNQKSIIDMAHGAFKERADYEMAKILENILDPNTKAEKKRTLTIQKVVPVSVRWDLTKDLSITKDQYKRIRLHAEKTGRTTTEVLRMLVAAGMQLMGEDESSC